ncbi:MAG: CooT family nickel-binding protein [Dehalococcoidales bacterium]|nr:MAG: CooT family nickel-binding protein [Dehalococcoidales bacterium]
MCLSKVYFERGGKKETLLDEVASVIVDDGKLQLKTLFGEQKEIKARIKQIDLVAHSILLEDS